MKRAIIFVWLLLLCGRRLDAQQDTPPPFPTQPIPSAKPSAPAPAVVPVPVTPPRPNGKIQNSLVRITVTEAEPDYKAPWNAGAIQRGVGAGFVIDGSRIMTNAHVVSNSRYLTVERDGDPNKYRATVQFVAHDCDLALITVSAPDFFKNMTPLNCRFLKDIEDGHYNGYVDLAISYSKLQNPAQRKFLGLKDDDRGVLVTTVVAAGPCAKILREGDVLLAMDDHPIASDSNVELEGARVEFPEVVERKFKSDKVKLNIWRDKQPMTVNVELNTVWPYRIQGHRYDVRPRYVVYGGLLFQPLNLDLIDAYQPTDLRIRHFFDYFVVDQIYLEHPDVIVLTNILPDPINTYLAAYPGGIVDVING